jgi:dihydrofolate synthase/folylpolyglutamate synthase
MDYRESVDYVTNAPLFGAHKNGLENIRVLLDRLGNPQDRLRVVHVAGTNGKGSVCAYTDAILRAGGIPDGPVHLPYLGAIHRAVPHRRPGDRSRRFRPLCHQSARCSRGN